MGEGKLKTLVLRVDRRGPNPDPIPDSDSKPLILNLTLTNPAVLVERIYLLKCFHVIGAMQRCKEKKNYLKI